MPSYLQKLFTVTFYQLHFLPVILISLFRPPFLMSSKVFLLLFFLFFFLFNVRSLLNSLSSFISSFLFSFWFVLFFISSSLFAFFFLLLFFFYHFFPPMPLLTDNFQLNILTKSQMWKTKRRKNQQLLAYFNTGPPSFCLDIFLSYLFILLFVSSSFSSFSWLLFFFLLSLNHLFFLSFSLPFILSSSFLFFPLTFLSCCIYLPTRLQFLYSVSFCNCLAITVWVITVGDIWYFHDKD